MPRLLLGNFDLETQLAQDRQKLPERLLRLNAELAVCWAAVARAGDSIWCPEPVPAEFWRELAEETGLPEVVAISNNRHVPPGLDLSPWGWTQSLAAWGAEHSLNVVAPPPDVVRAANSRRLSHQLEQEWDCGLEGACELCSPAAVSEALAAGDEGRRWVIKAEFGNSARERILGKGSVLTEAQVHWCRRRLARDGVLFLEPWIDRVDEAGVQWTLPRTGEPQLEGVVPLLCDAAGRYLGSVFADESLPVWDEAVEITRRAACRLQEMGYFGPLGIDAMRYRDREGVLRLRPLQDINARWTMGRLSLGWRRLLRRGERGVWRHGSAAELRQRQAASRILRTSPDTIGGAPVQHCTWIELAGARRAGDVSPPMT